MLRSPAPLGKVSDEPELIVYSIAARRNEREGLLEDTDQERGDGGMDQEENDNGGGDGTVAHGGGVASVDDPPNQKTDEDDDKGKEEVDEQVDVRPRNRREA